MKHKLFITITVVFMAFILLSSSVLAQGEQDGKKKVDVTQFPELMTKNYGVIEADNLLDPNSPNYTPALRYGKEGTRFGPPGKRNLDFYRRMGLPIGEDSTNLEKDLHEKDTEPIEDGSGMYWGTNIFGEKDVWMTQAYQKIYTNLYLLDNSEDLYAPTMLAPDYSRLEIVIRYTRIGYTTYRTLAVFAHSTTTRGEGDWYDIYDLDQGAFQYRYVNGNDEVITRIEKTGSENNPTWTAYLYDLIDNQWDSITSATGKSKVGTDGWSIWESYHLYPDWPTLPEITSRYLIVDDGSGPYYVTSSYGYPFTYSMSHYSTDMIEDYYEWSVGP